MAGGTMAGAGPEPGAAAASGGTNAGNGPAPARCSPGGTTRAASAAWTTCSPPVATSAASPAWTKPSAGTAVPASGGGVVSGASSGFSAIVFRRLPSSSSAFRILPLMSMRRRSLNSRRTSCRSASRTISSTWTWNSPAMRRAFLTIPATALIATGRSFGPISTRATTPISANSDQAKSNMRRSSPRRRPSTGMGSGEPRR